jgi:hypothetical protein
MKAICATTASACWGRRRPRTSSGFPDFPAAGFELWRTRVHASIIAKIHQLWPRIAGLAHGCHGARRRIVSAQRHAHRVPALGHLSRAGRLGNEPEHSGVRHFLGAAQFRVDPAVAAIATVVVSFAYAFVVGVGPPVWRAALMLATYLGARLLYRERNMMNAIGAAALGVLIVDPHALFGASFQLTFLAVFIIAGIGSPILERTTLPYARGLRCCSSQLRFACCAPSAQFGSICG